MPVILFAVFQGLFCVITGALVSGAIADRARFGAWMVFVSVWTVLVYAPVAHWVFDLDRPGHVGGWLANRVGTLDFAGGMPVEISSGASRARARAGGRAPASASARTRCGRTT